MSITEDRKFGGENFQLKIASNTPPHIGQLTAANLANPDRDFYDTPHCVELMLTDLFDKRFPFFTIYLRFLFC